MAALIAYALWVVKLKADAEQAKAPFIGNWVTVKPDGMDYYHHGRLALQLRKTPKGATANGITLPPPDGEMTTIHLKPNESSP